MLNFDFDAAIFDMDGALLDTMRYWRYTSLEYLLAISCRCARRIWRGWNGLPPAHW